VIVLYDAECGFCRWAMAWAMRRDRDRQIVAVPIQSALGGELLADLPADERLTSAHVVLEGRRRSGGDGAADVLSALPSLRLIGRLGHALPAVSASLYDFVAARRHRVGRLVGRQARRRADALLAVMSAGSAAELEDRLRAAGRDPSLAQAAD
jgi:predicted DCC family thiol-disulfide oxidoreductase YuxK